MERIEMTEEHRRLLRMMIYTIILYFIGKFLIRPWVLNADMPVVFDIIVLSLPNFCEAVVGSLMIANVALLIFRRKREVSKFWMYSASVFIAGIYVILQELKIHNLGGRNIYDPFDILFSVLGLLFSFLFLIKDLSSFSFQSTNKSQ